MNYIIYRNLQNALVFGAYDIVRGYIVFYIHERAWKYLPKPCSKCCKAICEINKTCCKKIFSNCFKEN